MAQLIKKALIIKDIRPVNRVQQISGIIKLQKNSFFKVSFCLKNFNIKEGFTAALISSNLPIQFIDITALEFDYSLPVQTDIEDIVAIIFSNKYIIPVASSNCDSLLFSGYIDTIKNLRKSKTAETKKIDFFAANEPLEIIKKEAKKEPEKIIPDNIIIKEESKDINNFEVNFNLSEDTKPAAETFNLNNFEKEKTSETLNLSEYAENNYIDDDVLLKEDSTLGDDLKIAEYNYYDDSYIYDNKDNGEKMQIKPYYESIKSELEELFNKHEHEVLLEKLISQSKFCKIMYEDNKYYVVGLIFEDNTPQFICYGVPTFNAGEPPKELKGFCSYIPTNADNLKELGYWIMYQSTDNGETIYPEK